MRETEKEILEKISQLLSSRTDRLSSLGLTWQGPEVEVWRQEEELYTSELRVTILKHGKLNDVLEFHIYRDGELLVTTEEALKWFEEQLEQIHLTM